MVATGRHSLHNVAFLRRFWQCPNGKECKYRHRLPPGFKLKSEIKELLASEAANKPSLEEEIEAQRQAVEARTPITEQARVKPAGFAVLHLRACLCMLSGLVVGRWTGSWAVACFSLDGGPQKSGYC